MSYVSETEQKISEARAIVSKLYDLRKRPFQFALVDMSRFLSVDLDRLGQLLDEAELELHFPNEEKERETA